MSWLVLTLTLLGREVWAQPTASSGAPVATPAPAMAAAKVAPVTGKDTLAYAAAAGKSPGIYLFRLETPDPETPQNPIFAPLGKAASTPNPTFLEVDGKRRLLFALNDVPSFQGKPGGAVSAFAAEPNGKLALRNQLPSQGLNPCHLTLDKDRKHLLVSNCGSGSVAVFPVAQDGKLGAPSDVVQVPGTRPFTQGIALSPDGQFAYASDGGLDRVSVFRFDASKGKLSAATPPAVALKAGFNPRHLLFRPDGAFAYLAGGKSNRVATFAHDGKTGALKELQSLSTLPPWFDGSNTVTTLLVHPSGNSLFAVNRGHDSIAFFSIDAEKGTLTYVEDQATSGKGAQHAAFDATGEHLGVVNQDTGTLLPCRIDADNGRLKPSGLLAPLPAATTIRLLPPRD